MPPDRRLLALVVTPLLCAAALGVVVAIGDVPVFQRRSLDTGETRAAVAIRDHVIPFQKWGTKFFTLPALEKSYDRVYYLTQRTFGDQRDQLQDAVADALAHHDHVDLFLLAHGNRFVDWIAPIDPALRGKLRLVYNTGCGGAVQADDWLALGADAYVGHFAPRSLSPLFYLYFLRRWVKGEGLAESVDDANRAATRRLRWFGLDDPAWTPVADIEGRRDLWIGGGP
jgi:hypothetical protein